MGENALTEKTVDRILIIVSMRSGFPLRTVMKKDETLI